MLLRLAEVSDSDSILNIYKPYILNTSVTFEYTVPSSENFRKRVESILSQYPYLVCEDDGNIVAYCYAARFKERAAFGWDCELSIYMKDEYKGRGIGKALYGAVIDICELMNLRNIYGLVVYPNEASEKLHERFGFQLEGVLKKTGYKFGEWLDVLLLVLHLGNDKEVTDIKYINEIEKSEIREILSRYQKNIR